jgi:hypothetical protein
MPTQAPIFELPKKKHHVQKPKKQPQPPEEPLPWGEGEPENPQPPFLPAA